MAFAEIPTQQEFKEACGRTGVRALFKTKNDFDLIFRALSEAEPHRKSLLLTAIPPLRKVRKACCAWIAANEGVIRVSAPKVRDLCDVVHKTINRIVESTYGGRRLALPQKPTLKDVVKRVMEVKGTVGPVGRTLDENYWIEKILPQHLGKGVVGAAFTEWKKNETQTRLNIADWLEQVYVPECEDDPFGKYIANRMQRLGKKISDGKGVKYCDEQERKSYVIRITVGKVQDAHGDIYDTTEESTVFSGKGWAIFVMAPDDTLYAHSHKADEFHHSSFLAGAPIKSAGEIQIKARTILKVTPKTGHYQAGPAELKYFLLFCQKNGVALKEMQVCPDPFDQKKKWFPGDEVLLAGGKEPTPDNIAAEKKVVPVVKVAVPVVKGVPPVVKSAPPGVKGLINKWEDMIAKQRQ